MKVKSKLPIRSISWGCLILIIITTIVYVWHFGWKSYGTSKPEHWGQFGDFIGGFLGTVIGVVNLVILVYLTKYVADEDNRKALNQFRFEFYLKLKENTDKFNPFSFSIDELNEQRTIVFSLRDYAFLFNESKEEYLSRVENFVDAMSSFKKHSATNYVTKDSKIKNNDISVVHYDNAKSDILKFVQWSMLHN